MYIMFNCLNFRAFLIARLFVNDTDFYLSKLAANIYITNPSEFNNRL